MTPCVIFDKVKPLRERRNVWARTQALQQQVAKEREQQERAAAEEGRRAQEAAAQRRKERSEEAKARRREERAQRADPWAESEVETAAAAERREYYEWVHAQILAEREKPPGKIDDLD